MQPQGEKETQTEAVPSIYRQSIADPLVCVRLTDVLGVQMD